MEFSISCLSLIAVMTVMYTAHAQTVVNPLEAYATCVQESNVPPITSESNPLLRTTFEMLQSYSILKDVLSCVDAKKEMLRTSTNRFDRYIGYTFDLTSMNSNLMVASDTYQTYTGSSCLRDNLAPQQLSCILNATYTDISSMDNVCSVHKATCNIMNSAIDVSCSPADQLLASVSLALLYGKCLYQGLIPGTTSMLMTSPKPETPSMPFPESTLFRCIAKFVPSRDIYVLFPPSESTAFMITNVTEAKERHTKTVQTFCKSIWDIKECVWQAKGAAITSQLDKALDTIMGDSLSMLDQYCSMEKTVTPQFECTFNSLSNMRCNGGVFDLIHSINAEINMTGTFDILKICDMATSMQSCRVNAQLTTCGVRYGLEMEHFYRSLIHSCHSDLFNFEKVDALQCFGKYTEEMERKTKEHVKGADVMEYDPVATLTIGLDLYCGKRKEWLSCLKKVSKNSTKPIDQMIFKVQIPDNIETMVNFACSVSDDIKKHAKCLVYAINNVTGNPNECMMAASIEMTRLMSNITSKDILSNLDLVGKIISLYCGSMKKIFSCVEPSITQCDAGFSKSYMTIANTFSAGCGAPDKVTLQQTNGHNHISFNILYILVSLYILHCF